MPKKENAMTRYNYCAKCQKWLGWPKYLVFWEREKICATCQKPKEIDIF